MNHQVITVDTSYSNLVRWPESQLMALNRHERSSMGMNTPMGLSEAMGDILAEDTSNAKTLKSLYKNTPHYNSFTDTGERSRSSAAAPPSGTSAQLVDGIGALDLDLDDIPVLEGHDDIDSDFDNESSSSSPVRKPRGSISSLLPPRHTGSNTNLLGGMSPLPRAPPATPRNPATASAVKGVSPVGGGIAGSPLPYAVPMLPLGISHPPPAPAPAAAVGALSPPRAVAAAHEAASISLEPVNWMTFEGFEQKFGTARFVEPLAALTTLTFTPRGTVADAAIPSSAETRGRNCHTELILAFRDVHAAPRPQAALPAKASAAAVVNCVDLSGFATTSRTFIRGRTAQRSTYDFELKPSEENRFVGKMVSFG